MCVCVCWAPNTPVVSSLDIVEKLLLTELYHGFVFIFSINIADPNDLCWEQECNVQEEN